MDSPTILISFICKQTISLEKELSPTIYSKLSSEDIEEALDSIESIIASKPTEDVSGAHIVKCKIGDNVLYNIVAPYIPLNMVNIHLVLSYINNLEILNPQPYSL